MNIIEDYIPPGKENRPHTNPRSSLYRKVMKPEYLTYHNPAWPNGDAKTVHEYGRRQWVRPDVKSWGYSVDKDNIYKMLPDTEGGWHSTDDLGPGNTNSIGMEVCDRGAYLRNWGLFWADQENAARLCAYLIKTIPSLRKFPDCMKQHYDWSGKNCPYWIRRERGGWDKVLGMVEGFLKNEEQPWPTHPIPKIVRTIGVEYNGERTDEVGYLIPYEGTYATYVRAAYVMPLAGAEVKGAGNHIKIIK